MNIRRKTLLILFLTTITLMAVLYGVSQQIMFNSIAKSENQEAESNAQRFVNNLNFQLQGINSTINDWAAWDDTYQFIETNNTAYLDSNLVDQTFMNLKLNMMLFMDQSRQVVFGKAFDLENETTIILQDDEISQISRNNFLYTNATEQTQGGLLLFGGSPMLIVSHPILTSTHEGPIRGTLIMGRFFDKSESDTLAQAVGLPLVTFTIGNLQEPSDFQLAKNSLSSNKPFFTNVLNETQVSGYVLLEDISGTPIMIARVDGYRTAYLQAKNGLRNLLASFVVLGIAVFSVSAVSLEKIVLSRLNKLAKEVVEIGHKGKETKYVTVTGKDELSNLGCRINGMIAAIKEAQEEIEKHAQILERKVEERTIDLKVSREKLKSIFRASPDAIIATDLQGKIVEYNREMNKITGYTRKDLVEKSAFSYITNADSKKVQKLLEEVTAKGSTINFECNIKKKNGSTCPAELVISSLRDQQEMPYGFVAIIRDLTEKKQFEKRLFQSERLAAIGELAGMVGHDLRNPLTGIKGAAYYLRAKASSRLNEKEVGLLETIDRSVECSNKIINDLLEYSRDLKLELVETTPKALIENLVVDLKIPSNVQFKDSTQIEPKIIVDVDKLMRVFLNLAKNAFDAMPQGGVLEITSESSRDCVVFAFTDTGTGMSQEILNKLWNPLFTTKAKGMGFGLPICKRISEAHKGKISVESTVGKGTTFKVTIPAQLSKLDDNAFFVDTSEIPVSH